MPIPRIRREDGTWLDLKGLDGAPGGDGLNGEPGQPGQDAYWGSWEADGPVIWNRDKNGIWTPAGNVRSVNVNFYKGTGLIAQRSFTVTRAADGTLSASAGSGTGTSQTVAGDGTRSLTVTARHNATDIRVVVALTSVLSGEDGQEGSPGDPGEDGTPGADAVVYYIAPLNGTVLKNHQGSLAIELRRVEGTTNAAVSSGDVRLYRKDTGALLGYSAVITANDITGNLVVEAKDGAGKVYDTIALVDVTDGLDAVVGAINASNGLGWVRQKDETWSPTGTTTDLVATFYRDGQAIAVRTVRVALNTSTGNLTATDLGGTGETTTLALQGGGTPRLSIIVTHSGSGATVAEGTFAVQSGLDGAPGDPGEDGTPGEDGQAGQDAIVYYVLPTNGTAIKNSTGTLGVEVRRIQGSVDQAVTSGPVRLVRGDTMALLGNGYSATLTAADIQDSLVVKARNTDTGITHDTVSLVDVSDGSASTLGAISANNGLAWVRDKNGSWSPGSITTDLVATFYREGASVATRTIRVTLNQSTGTLSGTLLSSSGEATTHQIVGGGTATVTVRVTHTASSAIASETVYAVQSGTDGEPGEDGEDGDHGADAVVVYILPLDGTAIKNSEGTLTIQLRRIQGSVDLPLTSGNIRLVRSDNFNVLGNGYEATLSAADIASKLIVRARDTVTGVDYDTIALVDVTDGSASTIGSAVPTNGLAWVRNKSGAWTPTATSTDLQYTFYREGQTIATRVVRVSLNQSTGVLSAANISSSGEATSLQLYNNNTATVTARVTHSSSGAMVSESVYAVQSGVDGSSGDPGDSGDPGEDGRDGLSNFAVRPNRSTFTNANLGEMYVHGLDDNGNPADVDGWIFWNGLKIAVARGSVFTDVADSAGYLVFETAGGNIFAHNGTRKDMAFAIKEQGTWSYDSNGVLQTFIPTDTMVALARVATGPGIDRIRAVALKDPTSLFLLPGDLTWEDIIGTDKIVAGAVSQVATAFTDEQLLVQPLGSSGEDPVTYPSGWKGPFLQVGLTAGADGALGSGLQFFAQLTCNRFWRTTTETTFWAPFYFQFRITNTRTQEVAMVPAWETAGGEGLARVGGRAEWLGSQWTLTSVYTDYLDGDDLLIELWVDGPTNAHNYVGNTTAITSRFMSATEIKR